MNLLTFQAFAKEAAGGAAVRGIARGAERLGGGIIDAAKGTGSILRDSVDPKRVKGGLEAGLRQMGNMTERKMSTVAKQTAGAHVDRTVGTAAGVVLGAGAGALTGGIKAEEGSKVRGALRGAVAGSVVGGALGAGGQRVLNASGRATGKAREAGHYVADFHGGTGVMDKLRQHGVLGNRAKYVGDNKLLKARNMAARALPGEAGVVVPLTGHAAYSHAKEKTDPSTGRERGVAERSLRAGVGLTTGIVGMRTGKVLPALAASMIGEEGGGGAGRLIDSGVSKARKVTSHSGSARPIGSA